MNVQPHLRPSARPALPPLRLVPNAGEQLALDLQWEVAPGIPAVPTVPALLHVVGEPGDVSSLPDPQRWTAQLARAVAEVLAGARPPSQLTRWVSRIELARLTARAAARAKHPAGRDRAPRVRTVRAVRVCPVAPGVLETSAVLVGPERSQAVALRLEAVGGRWLATVVDIR